MQISTLGSAAAVAGTVLGLGYGFFTLVPALWVQDLNRASDACVIAMEMSASPAQSDRRDTACHVGLNRVAVGAVMLPR